MEFDITKAFLAGVILVQGWLFHLYRDLRGEMQGKSSGLSYDDASDLIDLKIAPLQQEVRQLTKAVDRMTDALLQGIHTIGNR